MRWEALFADLEAQADALATAERAAEVEERARVEVGSLGVLERLRAAAGATLRLRVCGLHAVAGTLRRVGPDWLLINEDAGHEVVVALAAVLTISGLTKLSATPGSGSAVQARLSMRHALRGIARDRSAVRLHLVDGTAVDSTIDRVGADFAEVAAHAAGDTRRRTEVREVHLVPLAAIVAVRRVA